MLVAAVRPDGRSVSIIFGPIALMILYVLPKKPPLAWAGSADTVDPHEALYQVPKNKR